MTDTFDGTAATVTLELPPSPAHVRTARLIAAAMARRSGVDERVLDEVRLAVGEACTRAVLLHERHRVADPLTVEFRDGGRFSVAVVDRVAVEPEAPVGGPPGDPLPPPTGLDPPGRARARQEFPNRTAASAAAGIPAPNGWVDTAGDELGLALLGALVRDLAVVENDAAPGTRVTMSWPLAQGTP